MCCSQIYRNNRREKLGQTISGSVPWLYKSPTLKQEFRLIDWNEVLVCFTDKGLISTRIHWQSPCWTSSVLQWMQDYHNDEKTPPIQQQKQNKTHSVRAFLPKFFSVKEKTCIKSEVCALKIIIYLFFSFLICEDNIMEAQPPLFLSVCPLCRIDISCEVGLECYPMQ